ncbi:hypothetical protein [Aquibium sp. ELW1220]|uniref:hypothetical protein n=1 Tax=Aquibium sp. ELW1220 TaxID=2976766 RepID=UPI0025AFDFF5|nr:hypothetical protein [Aquibium sp. ELW1220]MDN2579732.1 hypothetical protein [Aquibium sp. ELW1220]
MHRIPFHPLGALALWLSFLLVSGCSDSGAPDAAFDPARDADVARILPAAEAIEGAHIPTLDPARLNHAEIEKALGAGPKCLFRYTSSGRPVLALVSGTAESPADAVIKLNGNLVVLEAQATDAGTVLTADPIRMSIMPLEGPDAEQREATAVFEIGDSLHAGYRGYYGCSETVEAATGA